MADLIKSVTSTALNATGVQRAAAAALAQPLASSAIRDDLLHIAPGLLNTGIIGTIDPGVLRPTVTATLSHVQPGELITATLMNAIIDRLNALAGNTGPATMTGDVTGTTAANQISALQGKSVLANAPAEGQLLGFSNNAWRPVAAPQATPVVVAAAAIQNRGIVTTGSVWGVTSMLGNFVSADLRAARFTFDGYNPTFNTYFFRFTLVDADHRGGIATVMPYVLRVDPGFFEIGFQPLGPEARFDPGLILQVEVAAYPRLRLLRTDFTELSSGLLNAGAISAGTLAQGAASVVANPASAGNPAVAGSGVLNVDLVRAEAASPGMVISSGPVAAAPGVVSGLALAQPVVASETALSARPAVGVSTIAEKPAATIGIRSAPAPKKSPARAPAAKPAPSKRTGAKKPAAKGGKGG
ncbi:hypothetical protein GCM10025771_11940 [Niveibacterium umoris]|uniref:Uncharacterized protein n=1 Tax=Niveibacterium umoris TaxID=1193620 RepID=A0A840BI73_9RHOO|nr:hypothetical protein [Niveibacterium umoris]MBB4013251.1 hypothetical protein [Niveibacterium umoris]